MGPLRIASAGVLGLRIAYGAAMLAAPERVGRPWIGEVADDPAGQVPLRGIGGREVAVHGIALSALLRGEPIRPFLAASLAGDLCDLSATFAGRRGLPDGALRATLVAGPAAMVRIEERGPAGVAGWSAVLPFIVCASS